MGLTQSTFNSCGFAKIQNVELSSFNYDYFVEYSNVFYYDVPINNNTQTFKGYLYNHDPHYDLFYKVPMTIYGSKFQTLSNIDELYHQKLLEREMNHPINHDKFEETIYDKPISLDVFEKQCNDLQICYKFPIDFQDENIELDSSEKKIQ
jgi:hypothetical protein